MISPKTEMLIAAKAAVVPVLQKHGGGSFEGFSGQFQDEDGTTNRGYSLKYPCCLWQIIDLPWKSSGHKDGGTLQHTKEALIEFHIGFKKIGRNPLVDSNIFNIVDEISAAVASIDGSNFGSFYRTNERQDVDFGHVVDYVVSFRFGIGDDSTFVPITQSAEISETNFAQMQINGTAEAFEKNQTAVVNIIKDDTSTNSTIKILSITQPRFGASAVLNGDQTVSIIPDLDFVGASFFTYQATNGFKTETGVFSFYVSPEYVPPPVFVENQPLENETRGNHYGLQKLSPRYNGPSIEVIDIVTKEKKVIGFVGKDLDFETIELMGDNTIEITGFFNQNSVGDFVAILPEHRPTIATGGTVYKVGGLCAAYFDGYDDYVSGASDAAFPSDTDFTLYAAFKVESGSAGLFNLFTIGDRQDSFALLVANYPGNYSDLIAFRYGPGYLSAKKSFRNYDTIEGDIYTVAVARHIGADFESFISYNGTEGTETNSGGMSAKVDNRTEEVGRNARSGGTGYFRGYLFSFGRIDANVGAASSLETSLNLFYPNV